MRKEVKEYIISSMDSHIGNPSSLHRLGLEVEKEIKRGREVIASILACNFREIYFTSGGTESNNIAIISSIEKMKSRGRHIITTEIEHPSVLNVFKHYEGLGMEVSYVKVGRDGNLDLLDLENKLREDTILVSTMLVNNEIGSLIDVSKIGKMVKDNNKETIYHVDGVQGFLKTFNGPLDGNIDLFSFSGHKIYGPKGVGGLYINKDLKLPQVVFGGNQEQGLRSGTENTIGILGMTKAIEISSENYKSERAYVAELKEYFIGQVEENIEDIIVNSPKNSSPYIINISFKDTKGEIILHYLEDEEIYVSTSSACSSNGTEKSHVLKALGLNDQEIGGSLRFCLSYENTREDLDKTICVLKRSIEEIREIMRRR